MKLTFDQYSNLRVIYPKRKPNLKERTYTFSYKVNNKLSTCVEISEAVYKCFVDGLTAYSIYKDSNWILCIVVDDFVHSHSYVVMKDQFEEEDLELLFPPLDVVYVGEVNEISDDLVDGLGPVDDSVT